MINFCTYFDKGYLDKGICLYQSLESCCDSFTLFICCNDEITYQVLNDSNYNNAVLIRLEQIEDEKLLRVKNERTRAEYYWTCTPVIIEYVLRNYPVESCTYIDADLFFYRNPKVLIQEIQTAGANIGIMEHRFPSTARGRRMERRSGKYCVEFNYFDQSKNARQALQWWKERCLEWCYHIYEKDRMGDQKYLELFPKLFQGVYEIGNLGAGVAPWNFGQYSIADHQMDPTVFRYKKHEVIPLVFFHFQNIRYIGKHHVNIASGTHDVELKKAIYYPYIKKIEGIRRYLMREYNIVFDSKKTYSSKKWVAILQRGILRLKTSSLSDIIDIRKLL